MAQRIIRTDDLDGSDNASEVVFSFDGVTYRVDLAPHNYAKLKSALTLYMEKATNDKPKPEPKTKAAADHDYDPAAVRLWAAETGATWKGRPVSSKGRVPQQIVDEYQKAMANAAEADKARDALWS